MVSYLLIVILNLIQIRRLMPHMDSTVKTALPMLLSALVMGAASYAAYFGLCLFLSPKVAVVPAILLAVVVYGACAVLFRAVTYDDVVLLPKGRPWPASFASRSTPPPATCGDRQPAVRIKPAPAPYPWGWFSFPNSPPNGHSRRIPGAFSLPKKFSPSPLDNPSPGV